MRHFIVTLLILTPGLPLGASGWRAGVARVDITPKEPIWLAGYASRNEPSSSVAGPLAIKAIALEDGAGRRIVAITGDLITMPRTLAEPVARRLAARHALPRDHILLTASHTHSGPVLQDALESMYFLDEPDTRRVAEYTRRVEEALFAAGDRALESLREADVAVGFTSASFAINRRRVLPNDPVDHEVPVVVVRFREGPSQPDGLAGAVWFSYACHNTTLNGLEVCGDWAGFAQSSLEERRPELLAVFSAGCAGDQNPDPRRTMELAVRHGRDLADAVLDVLDDPLETLEPSIATAFGRTPLPFAPPPSRAELEERAGSENRWIAALARRHLAHLDAGRSLETSYAWPAQVWRLGEGHWVVGLAGEAVVEYSLRLKRELPERVGASARVIPLAYVNDVPGYIPSEKVLREGGYEGATSMIYYGRHGPWAPGVEERCVAHVHHLVDRARSARGLRPAGAELTHVWSEGAFTEGPAWSPDGALWISDIPNDRIIRLAEGNAFVAVAPSGRANGLAFDGEGRLVACEGADGGGRRVVRRELDGSVTVLAERVDGRRLNSPNDLTFDGAGRVWFSDPRYVGDEPREIDAECVYRIDAPGEVERAIDGLTRPNGLAVSPDGGTLYVSDAGARVLLAYRIDQDGHAQDRRVVFDFGEGRGVDGMEVDAQGVIWAAAGAGSRSGVWAIHPSGELLDFIATPETATNCCFGEDGRTLFITAGRSVYRTQTLTLGLGFQDR